MTAYTPVSKLVSSPDGSTIYADALGDPSLPAIVFIHGLALSSICFDVLFDDPKWLEHVYLIRYDMRGHGRSSKPEAPEEYASKKEADDFMAVIAAFGVKKAFLAGWSMGATIAADLATHVSPSPLLGVIYISGLPYVGPIMGKVGTPVVLGMLPGLMSTDDVPLSMKTASDFVYSLVSNQENISYRTRVAWIGDIMSQSPAARTQVLTRPQDPAAFLDKTAKEVPLLMLHGTEDTQIFGNVLEEELKGWFGSRLTVKFFTGTGHAFFMEIPGETRDAVVQFVHTVVSEKH